jgi:hypothetical protein
MHELSDAAPLPPTADDVRLHRPPTPRSRAGVLVISAVLVVAAVAGLVAVASRPADGPAGGPAGGGLIEVYHARYRVSIDAQLDCDTPIDEAGTFRSMTIDTWSDRVGRRWRNQVTYPDGTTLDLVLLGSAIYPTGEFQLGERHDSSVGCLGPGGEPFVLAGGPDLFFTLTLAPELAVDERPYVRLFDDTGSLIDTDAVDEQGRPTQRWEQRINGTAGYGDVADMPILQVTSWWIDASDNATVTQRRFENTVETLGTASTTETLVLNETVKAPETLFDTAGYQTLEVEPRPDPPTDPPTGPAPTPPESAPSATPSESATSPTAPTTIADAAPDGFCNLAVRATHGEIAMDVDIDANELVNYPGLSALHKNLIRSAVLDAILQVRNGSGWDTTALVDAVNEICNLTLTPVTMVP